MFPGTKPTEPNDDTSMSPKPVDDSTVDTAQTPADTAAGMAEEQTAHTSDAHTSATTGLPSIDVPQVSSVDQEPSTAPGQSDISTPATSVNSESSGAPDASPSQSVNSSQPDDVVYTPVVVPPATQPMTTPPKRSRTKLILIIVAAVLVVLLGSGAAVYALWYNNPQKVMIDALQSAATARTSVTSGTIVIAVEDGADDVEADISFTTKAHQVDSHGQLAAQLKLTTGDTSTSFSGEAMVAESGAVFVKFNDVAKLYKDFIEQQDMAAMLKQDQALSKSIDTLIKKIDGKWIKISQDDIRQVSSRYDYDKFKACYQAAQNTLMQSREQQQELRAVYTDHEFITLTPQGGETIDGALTNHYAVGVNVSKAYDAYAAYENSAYAKASQACNTHVSDAVSEYEKVKKPSDSDIRDQQQQMDKVKTDVYVTQFTHQLKRVTVSYADNESKSSFHSTFDFDFSQQVSSPEPSSSVSIKEIQSDLEDIGQRLMTSEMQANPGLEA